MDDEQLTARHLARHLGASRAVLVRRLTFRGSLGRGHTIAGRSGRCVSSLALELHALDVRSEEVNLPSKQAGMRDVDGVKMRV